MITIEQIDELRKRVNVTYAEAKEALEASSGELIEAIIYLEKNGKVNKCSSDEKQNGNYSDNLSDAACGFIAWCKKWIKKGNSNYFSIRKKEKSVLEIPVTLLIIIFAVAPWITIPLLVLALFTGHKLRFRGSDVEKTKVNDTMEKASVVVENIKEEVQK